MRLSKTPMVRDVAIMVAGCGGLLCIALVSGSEPIVRQTQDGVPPVLLVQQTAPHLRHANSSTLPKEATVTLRYYCGTPSDSGGDRTTALFRGDGFVKIIERRNEQNTVQPLPGDVVVYENDALSPELVRAIFQVADEAVKEKPFRFQGMNEDGCYINLSVERPGARPTGVFHTEMREYSDAPPAMRKLHALVLGLYPPPSPRHWSVVVRLMRVDGSQTSRSTHVARIVAGGAATIIGDNEILYQADPLPGEDFDILSRMAQQACREPAVEGGTDAGLEARLEILKKDGTVIMQHHDRGLQSFGKASPGIKRVIRWINDHLPKADRIDQENISERSSP